MTVEISVFVITCRYY